MAHTTPTSVRPVRRQRRSAEQWQSIVTAFHQSGLNEEQFCEEHDIGYVSLCKWRRHFSSASNTDLRVNKVSNRNTTTVSEPAFIDLDTIASISSPLPAPSSHWHIVLKLGNGVELCLSQIDVSP